MNVQLVEVEKIDPPLFNSRLAGNTGTQDELRALGTSLQSRQLEPIGVTPTTDGTRYRLVWGSRRVMAAKLVGMKTLNAEVLPAMSEGEEALANAIENLQRKDLTVYEQARVCATLREKKMSGKQVAAELNLSVSHISNLAICYEHLPEVIKTAWREGGPATDMNFLRSIITKEADGKKTQASEQEMIDAWKERVASLQAVDGDEEEDEDEDEDEEEDGPVKETGGVPPPSKFTVQKARYKQLLKALRSVRASQMCVDACRYLVGDIEKIRGVPIEAPKPKKEPDEPKQKKTTKGKDK